MATDKSIQQALVVPYSLPYFSQHVLQPIFGEHLTVYASSIPMPLNPSETRVATSIKKYGEIKLTDNREVDLYEVALSESVVVERNKVSIGTLVKKLIYGNNAVLANFHYPDHPERSWRFSFIAKDQILEDGEARRVETNPKRYTYILGPNERCKTAGERFSTLSTQSEFTVKAFEDAFSVEKLSDKFFKEYKEHYQAFVDHLSKRATKASVFNGDEKAVRDFAKKLLGRIVFLHFVQKKGWLGATNDRWQDGNRNFIQDLFLSSGKKETFYPLWLRTLFYDSLNNPERKNNSFKLPDGTTVMVPYLNGGLFEDDDPKGTLTFPPSLFEDLFEFFNQYNFTIYEDSPDDHTVAVDPEMLGHIFENLLEDNKDKGAYYTPKEIVHYMCQESLIEYLATKLDIPESVAYQKLGTDQTQMFGNEVKKGQFDLLNEHKTPSPGITREDVERFIKQKETTLQIIAHAKNINKHLDDVKICDPAIGSGAFPMGLLQEIFYAKQVLKEIADVPELRSVKNADIKENIIQNSIYGVDIEKGAVDIARLRFWLSLIVDEELPRVLPNLDFKIIVGDSLLPKLRVNDEEEIVDIDWSVVLDTTDRSVPANKAKIEKLRADLNQLVIQQRKYFSVRTEKDKTKLKQTIRDLKIEILVTQLQLDKIKYSEASVTTQDMFGGGKKDKQEKQKKAEVVLKLAGYQQTIKHLEQLQKHPNKPLQFFDWKLDFPEILNSAIAQHKGFDILIGNPPYGATLEDKSVLKNAYPRTSFGNIDSYKYFIDRGISLRSSTGSLCYITSDSYLEKDYFEDLRKLLLEASSSLINIHLGDNIFEKVSLPTCIIQSLRQKGDGCRVYFADLSIFESSQKLQLLESHDFSLVRIDPLLNNSLLFVARRGIVNDQAFDTLISCYDQVMGVKVYQVGKGKPKQTSREINNDVFISDKRLTNVYHKFIDSGVKRYYYEWNHTYIKYGKWLAEPRELKYFLSPKILIREVVNPRIFACYVEEPAVVKNTNAVVIAKTKEFDLKYLLGIINSTYFNDYVTKTSPKSKNKSFPSITSNLIKNFPMIGTSSANQTKIINVVDRILLAKKKDPLAKIAQLDLEIDVMVYHLYNLTYAEAKVIDPALTEEEFEKGRAEK